MALGIVIIADDGRRYHCSDIERRPGKKIPNVFEGAEAV